MNQNAVETRANLLEAFLRIYENKSVAQVTVKEICNLAGYNRTTFYNHFVDVPSMLGEIEDEILIKIKGIVSQLSAAQLFQSDAIFVAVKGIYQDNQLAMSMLMTKTDSHFPQKIKALMEQVITGFHDDLSEADSRKLKTAISYHFSAIIGVMAHWMENKETLEMPQVIDYVKEISHEGVLKVINKMI